MQSPRFNILYVESDEGTAELIPLMFSLRTADCTVTTIRTPAEALRRAAGSSFDLYLLNFYYHDMTGIELCRKLREIDGRAPVMFFSAGAHPAERQAAMLAGASAYLVKPDDLGELTGTAQQLLAATAAPARRRAQAATQNATVSAAVSAH